MKEQVVLEEATQELAAKGQGLRIAEQSRPTTDEDALCELKTGKYWNKAQRK